MKSKYGLCPKASTPSLAARSTTSQRSGKLLPVISLPSRARTRLRPPSAPTRYRARTVCVVVSSTTLGALAVRRAGGGCVHDADTVGVLGEVDAARGRAAPRRGGSGPAAPRAWSPGRLVEEVHHRPAQRLLRGEELDHDLAVRAHPLHGAVDVHVGVDLVCHARGLEDPHGLVVGVDGARVAVELGLALEDQDAQAAAAEQVGQGESGRAEPDHGDVVALVGGAHRGLPSARARTPRHGGRCA